MIELSINLISDNCNSTLQVHQWEVQGPHATGEAVADPETRQDAFPAAAGHDEEAVGMGTVLEELGLSKTLRPLPAESALDSAKGSGVLGRKQTSSRSSAASRRTTQQDPRFCQIWLNSEACL